MSRLVGLLVVWSSLWLTIPAQADLIDLGNGMIYDTVQDLTWLQDAAYVMTTGYDGVDADRQRLDGDPALDGLFVWGRGPADWVAQLEFGGVTGWRLPRYFGGGWEHGRSEMTVMTAQLGWRWEIDPSDPTSFSFYQGATGPFVNWNARSVWLGDANNQQWNRIYGTDIGDPGSRALAWAVRDGLPSQVPGPSTLTLLVLGLGLSAAGVRRRQCHASQAR